MIRAPTGPVRTGRYPGNQQKGEQMFNRTKTALVAAGATAFAAPAMAQIDTSAVTASITQGQTAAVAVALAAVAAFVAVKVIKWIRGAA